MATKKTIKPKKAKSKKVEPKTKKPREGRGIFVAVGLGAGFAFLSGIFFVAYLSSTLPPVEEIGGQVVSASTKIFDRTGEVLLYEIHGAQKRTILRLDEIPESVKQATISIEDANFYSNPAFDWRGILRAIWVNIKRGGAFQGGSTITQQLAKNTFLSPERTITRKIKELILASRLEKRYSKDEILELYLNQVPYGSNAYGIEAAARLYFNKSATELNLNESATLASMTKAPTYYSPWGDNYDELIKRKNLGLEKMRDLGFITEAELEEVREGELVIASQSSLGIKAPHFVMHIQEYLSNKYGEEFIKTAGLEVITTLDWEMEQLAEAVVKKGVERNTELYEGRNGALVAIDPKTGQILAMVGSADYFDVENEGNFNVATKGLRQPGSALKPFAYMTAFQKGLTPDTLLWDVKTEFDTTNNPENSYAPGNFDEIFRGPVDMKNALAQSINVPAVKTLYLAGVEDTIKNSEKMGITTLKDISRFGLSLVLGGGEVRLVELVGAYSVLAADGVRNPISSILKVTDKNGEVLEEYKELKERVLEPQYPRLINDILSDSKLRAPLYQSSLPLTQVSGYQVALKTGTTNNYVDAWTIGYTPNLAVGVWAGNNHREPLQKKGGSILAAIPMWHEFFSKAILSYEPEVFQRPEPATSDTPFLRGELTENDSHNILYHLQKTNDPQFENWEDGVVEWLTKNTVNYSLFSPSGSAPAGKVALTVSSPVNGGVVSNNFINLTFSASSSVVFNRVDILFNGGVIDTENGSWEEFSYNKLLQVVNVKTQNLLEIRVFDSSGLKANESVILFQN